MCLCMYILLILISEAWISAKPGFEVPEYESWSKYTVQKPEYCGM